MHSLYKCTARAAVTARCRGWDVRRAAGEQALTPQNVLGLTDARHAGLRRKLRKAEKVCIEVERVCGPALPIGDLAAVAAFLAAGHGGESGFSIGRCAADDVTSHRVYVARQRGRAVALATLHAGRAEWARGLVRSRPIPSIPKFDPRAPIHRSRE